MSKNNKTEKIDIRLTSEEKKQLMEKARNYKSLSAYILHSCFNFDDRATVRKLEFIDSWITSYKQYRNEFNSLANNLNQVAFYVNSLHNAGILNDNFVAEDKLVRDNLLNLLSEINHFNKKLEKEFHTFVKM